MLYACPFQLKLSRCLQDLHPEEERAVAPLIPSILDPSQDLSQDLIAQSLRVRKVAALAGMADTEVRVAAPVAEGAQARSEAQR